MKSRLEKVAARYGADKESAAQHKESKPAPKRCETVVKKLEQLHALPNDDLARLTKVFQRDNAPIEVTIL